MDEWLHIQHFLVHGTSYFWNGFVISLSRVTSQLGWKVGNGQCIMLGVDPIAGLNAPFMFFEGLREYICDFGIAHLFQDHNLEIGPDNQDYWYTAADLNLGCMWE